MVCGSLETTANPFDKTPDKFVLKLNDTGNTYRLEKLKPGDYKGIVYKVLGNNKDEVIAYAKTPPANDDRNWEQFRNEISATKDVRLSLANLVYIDLIQSGWASHRFWRSTDRRFRQF